MQDRTKNLIIVFVFCTILIFTFVVNCFAEDIEVSKIERRRLAQFPQITSKKILNGSLMEEFDKYTVDQFMGRDFFRRLKSLWSINILKQKDDNKYFEKDGAIYKLEYPLNIENLNKSIDKLKNIYDKHLKNMNVYFSIIPDKNYYLNDEYLKLDYDTLVDISKEKLDGMQYINIFETLDLNNYYKTDIHWKQEKIFKTVNKIQEEMNLKLSYENEYEVKNYGEFYGTYYGQIGSSIEADEIHYLTNDLLENCETYNYETNKTNKVYDETFSNDRYDIFVSGPTPLITIENPNSDNDKELLLFRDSFGSSLAPLLMKNYSKITLVDIRYISSDMLDKFIKFENQDVLFLYSTLVLNQNILK